MELIEKLTEEGILNEEEAGIIEKKAETTGKTPEEVLLSGKTVTEEELFRIKSKTTGFPLKGEIIPGNISEDILRIIPEDSASYYKMVALNRTGGEIEIGMVYPENLKAQEALKFMLRRDGYSYNVQLITITDFWDVFSLYGSPVEKISTKIVEKLVEKEIISKKEALLLEKEAEKKGKTPEEVLLSENTITEEELFDLKSEAVGFPLKKDSEINEDVALGIDIINNESANHYKMMPIGRSDNDEIEIGMVYPENLKAQEALKFISRQNIFSYKIYLITFTTFKKLKDKKGVEVGGEGVSFLKKLEERGLLDEKKVLFVEKESEEREKTKEEVILDENIIEEEELFQVKGEFLGIEFRKEIDESHILEEDLKSFPEDMIDHYKMIPIGRSDENELEIGMVYPEDKRAEEALALALQEDQTTYKKYLISFNDFEKIKKKAKSIGKEFASALSEVLVKEGLIEKEKMQEIDEKAEQEEKSREEFILEEGLLEEDQLFEIKSRALDVPFKERVNVNRIAEDILRVIPEDSANFYKMAPLLKEDNEIEIGMVYPENLRAREALNFLARRDNFSYKISLISFNTFEEIIKEYRTLSKEMEDVLDDISLEIDDSDEVSIDMDQDVGRLAEEAPIVKVVAVILRNAIEGGASDIHIEPAREKMKIRFRVDGILYSSLYLPMNIHLAIVARIKILAGMKIDEQRMPQDGRFSTKRGDKNIDFRVSTFPTTLGEKIVIRVLDPTEGMKSLDELGVLGRNLQIIQQSIKKPVGMTLVTGPTGSGKSTTLYSILGILNQEQYNIVTLEDPVEYFVDGVNQSQVNPEIGYVFAKGLRQILRQDPDVIMVGEIRDEETAELAIHAALTGHMVLSTLHTNSAIGSIPRLIDMGIKPFLLPPAVNSLMSQRLVRRLCDHCKEQVEPMEEIRMMISEELEKIPKASLAGFEIPKPLKIYTAKGCKYCSEEGVVGRISINEVLKMSPEIGEIVMQNPTERELEIEARKQGMITLKQDGMLKVVQGLTTLEEVLRATEEK